MTTATMRLKKADVGDHANNSAFAQAFSNVAYSALSQKSPQLLNHSLGLQLLDLSPDGDNGLGVMGFKIGSDLLLAPVWWKNGELKGNDLLYCHNEDRFVPLDEEWVQYLLNRKPNIMGTGINRNTHQIGVRMPNLVRLTVPPSKFASAGFPSAYAANYPDWLKEAMPRFARAMLSTLDENFQKLAAAMDLGKYLHEEAALETIEHFLHVCRQIPKVAAAYDHWHGLEKLSAAIKAARRRDQERHSLLKQAANPRFHNRVSKAGSMLDIISPPYEPPVKRGALKMIDFNYTQNTEPPYGMNEEDAKKLLRDGYVIQDNRWNPEVSTKVTLQPANEQFFNPTMNGLYEVLIRPGKTVRCLVLMNPHGPNGRGPFATVVEADGGEKRYVNVAPTMIWCRSQHTDQDYRNWFEKLPEAGSLGGSQWQMLLSPTGLDGTCPLRISSEYGDEYAGKAYRTRFDDYCEGSYRGEIPAVRWNYNPGPGPEDAFQSSRVPGGGAILHLDSKSGRKLRSDSGDLFVPPGYKRIELAGTSGDFAPGTLLETELGYVSPAFRGETNEKISANLHRVTIYHDGREVELDRRRLSPKEALFSLVRDYHLREKDAREMLVAVEKQAAGQPGGAAKQVFYLQPPVEMRLKMAASEFTQHEQKHLDWLHSEGARRGIKKDDMDEFVDTHPSWQQFDRQHGTSYFTTRRERKRLFKHLEAGHKKQAISPYGQDPYLGGQGPQAPAIPEPPMGYDQVMGSGIPLQGEQKIRLPVPELSAWLTDPTIYNPNTMLDVTPMDRVQSRPQYENDQKAVFDASSVGRLMHTARDDTLVDQHIKKLMDGMDATGRILFGFYQHPDKFAERYGKAEMPEMEDSLRNLFQMGGKVSLFLKQKTVEPHQDAALADQDLEPVAE